MPFANPPSADLPSADLPSADLPSADPVIFSFFLYLADIGLIYIHTQDTYMLFCEPFADPPHADPPYADPVTFLLFNV